MNINDFLIHMPEKYLVGLCYFIVINWLVAMALHLAWRYCNSKKTKVKFTKKS